MSELFLLMLILCPAPPPCAHLVGPAQRGPCWAVAKTVKNILEIEEVEEHNDLYKYLKRVARVKI